MTSASQTTTPLLDLVLNLLTPLLLLGAAGDASLARLAAQDAIAAYTASGHTNLVNIAQIVGFTLASLDNLRLSADPDLSVSMKLRLRGNANALARTAQHVTNIAEAPLADTQVREILAQETADDASALQALEQVQTTLAQPASDPVAGQAPALCWANAMTDVAAECARGLEQLPPAQRRGEIIRIAALAQTARQLSRSSAKADLLTSTILSNDHDRNRNSSETASKAVATSATITVAMA